MKSLAMIAVATLLTCTNGSDVAAFRQSACTGSIVELENGRRRERAEIEGAKGEVRVAYHDAHFRCDQEVAAYAKVRGNAVDILVQPADMNPRTVAKCDCLYDITFSVIDLPPATYDVTVQRRWDEKHGVGDPVRVGSARVTVR